MRYPASRDQHRVAWVQLDLVAVINLVEPNREWDDKRQEAAGHERRPAAAYTQGHGAARTLEARKILPCDGEVTHFSYRFKFSCVGAIMKNTFLPESTWYLVGEE